MNKFVNFRFWLLPFGNKHIDIRFFSLVHGQVNWKKSLVRSNKWTTRTIDFATPAKDIKLQCYKSLVRSVLDYAAAAWDPHTQTCITQLHVEAVQRWVSRFIIGNYRTTSSTSQMIANLGLPSLELRRQHSKLMIMYQITYGLVDIPANLHLRQLTTSIRGHSLEDMDGAVVQYWIPYCRTDIYRHSFSSSSLELVCGINYRRLWQSYRSQSHSEKDWLATPLNSDIILTAYTIFTFIDHLVNKNVRLCSRVRFGTFTRKMKKKDKN